MQTFIPYPDLKKSVDVLDYKRLGKQRVECLQIANALIDRVSCWFTHPAVQMYDGYVHVPILHGILCCRRWKSLSYIDNTAKLLYERMPEYYRKKLNAQKWADWRIPLRIGKIIEPHQYPPWWGREDVHASHRANLTRKDPEWYGRYWNDKPATTYIWPHPGDMQ